jgi:hypothetical protein
MSQFDSFQALVGRDQGATRLYVTAAGFFNVGDVVNGANGTDIAGSTLQRLLLSPATRTSFTMASAIQTVSVIPIGYGLVDIYYPSATTSVKLPAANLGATLMIRFGLGAVASQVSILAATSASLAYGYSDCSVLMASFNGGASGAYVRLVCNTANEWAVADSNTWNSIFWAQRSS